MKKRIRFSGFVAIAVIGFLLAACGGSSGGLFMPPNNGGGGGGSGGGTTDLCTSGHDFGSWVFVAATCTEAGKDERTCSVCGQKESQNSISNPAKGHNWSNGFCSVCDVIEEMIYVEGGSFQYGMNGSLPAGITLSEKSFYIGKYEVTQEQYEAVMGVNPSYFIVGSIYSDINNKEIAPGEIQKRRPVEWVSWYNAIVFCNKLSMKEDRSPAYRMPGYGNSTDPAFWGAVPTSNDIIWNAVEIVPDSKGYRLPTSRQWEYAAKGGRKSAGYPGGPYYIYSGSNNPGEVAWYEDNSNDGTTIKSHQVGKLTANELGIYDMSGNVFEWCFDWYSSGYSRMLCGGFWWTSAENLCLIYRSGGGTGEMGPMAGFRVVRP